MSRVTNIFVDLHEALVGDDDRRFGSGWEDLFTEQLAFFLAADLPAATALARTLMCRDDIAVEGISTQVTTPGGVPDLRLELAGGDFLHVEHKFDSPLGILQLERYLDSGPVALVSRRNQSISADVLQHSDYVRPVDREYFRWRDVYEALCGAEPAAEGFGALREHFKGYMRELGLAPSSLTSEWRRLFEDGTDPENQLVQKEFGEMLDPVESELRIRGFKVQSRSHKGKQAHPPAGPIWNHLYVNPEIVRADYLESFDCAHFEPGYEGLLVELIFDMSLRDTVRRIHAVLNEDRQILSKNRWYVVRPQRINTNRIRLTLASPLVPYLDGGEDVSRSLTNASLWAIDRLLNAVEAVTGVNGEL